MLWKRVVKCSVAVFLMILLIAPLFALFHISKLEQAKYGQDIKEGDGVTLVELAYGEIFEVMQDDIYETIHLSGQVISTGYIYQELKLDSPYLLRLWVHSGDYLRKGDIIGMYKGKKILASMDGIISNISMSSECYIEYYDMDKLAFECYVTEDMRRVLERESLALTNADNGTAYEVIRLEDVPTVPTDERLYRVLISATEEGSFFFGETIGDISMHTGRVYPNSIVVNSNCVYTRGDEQYYVRLINPDDGTFIKEVPVKIGETVEGYTCVSGVEPGQFCDAGYKAVVESGGANEGT